MLAFVVRRVAFIAVLVVASNIIVFLLTQTLGDPALMMLPIGTSEEVIQSFREAHGWDKPLYQQFLVYLGGALRGDFGLSYTRREPALRVVLRHLPKTALLAGIVALASVLIGMSLGTVAAFFHRTVVDRALTLYSLLSISVADFWIAIMGILLFAVRLRWVATSGFGFDFRHLALPVLALVLRPIGRTLHLTRTALLEEKQKDYVTTARSKGLSESAVGFGHVVRNVLVIVVTLIGYDVARLFAGTSVVIESVFHWPGIGLLAIQALDAQDVPLIQATVFVVSMAVGFVNLLIDLSYGFIDPRVRI